MLCEIKYVELVFFFDLLLTTFLNIWLALKRAVEILSPTINSRDSAAVSSL